jgi:beta-1,4-mannosyl-glycoprotein beta-1,4-N-acetylglucosaminyltransferase
MEFSKKIIDCFIFYNELELLTYRLNILNNVVDYFIIVESTFSFIGKEKKLFYDENKHLFENFKDKIIHIIVDDIPYKYPNINIQNGEQWLNEIFQRNCIERGFLNIPNLNDYDNIIISDLDEIPDPNTLYNIKQNNIAVDINTLEMDFYYYNLYTKFSCKWYHPKIISYKIYKEQNMKCNDIRMTNASNIEKGGWHLSYFGDSNFIKNKINNFSHQELNIDEFTDLSKIEKRINEGIDLFDRGFIERIELCNNTYLPYQYDIFLNTFY